MLPPPPWLRHRLSLADCQDQLVDGAMLAELTDQQLKDELGIAKMVRHTAFPVASLIKWTILPKYGPNHLGLRYNALPEHQMDTTMGGKVD